jgi:hypothetical protein
MFDRCARKYAIRAKHRFTHAIERGRKNGALQIIHRIGLYETKSDLERNNSWQASERKQRKHHALSNANATHSNKDARRLNVQARTIAAVLFSLAHKRSLVHFVVGGFRIRVRAVPPSPTHRCSFPDRPRSLDLARLHIVRDSCSITLLVVRELQIKRPQGRQVLNAAQSTSAQNEAG